MSHPRGGHGNYFSPIHTFKQAYEQVGQRSLTFTSTTGEQILAKQGSARDGTTPTIVFNRHGNVCNACWGYRRNCSGTRIGHCAEALDKYMTAPNTDNGTPSKPCLVPDRNSVEELKSAFLTRYNPERTLEKALSRAISAAVQHNALYKKEVTQRERESVRRKWMEFLKQKKDVYRNEQPVEIYENDIQELKALMNEAFCGNFLSESHPIFGIEPGFRISHAQKSLSVFLKHLWCMGAVAIPPQCPVDARILAIVGKKYPDTKWGYVNSIDEHRKKISFLDAAKEESDSLAEWELKHFTLD